MNPDKIILRQQKTIKELEEDNAYLKAELTYWEELATEWRDQYEEAESKLQYWKDTARYHQIKLKEIQKILNKTLDN